jgi:hypothetical protein
MTREVPDVIKWKSGFGRMEELRRQEIRESTILRDLPFLNDAYESALHLGFQKKKTSGLGELGKLLIKMNQWSV